MIKVLMACFLTFAIIGSPNGAMPMAQTRSLGFDPSNINTAPFEVEAELTHVGLGIGRHRMIQILDYTERGEMLVYQSKVTYNGSLVENVVIRESMTSCFETSISTTERFSAEISLALAVQAGIPGVDIGAEASVTSGYEFEQTTTYTISTQITLELEYEIKQEYIEGRQFRLGLAGNVYELAWDTWQWDDYWWGAYEVDGSRQHCTAYVVGDPYITIVYDDGSFISVDDIAV